MSSNVCLQMEAAYKLSARSFEKHFPVDHFYNFLKLVKRFVDNYCTFACIVNQKYATFRIKEIREEQFSRSSLLTI